MARTRVSVKIDQAKVGAVIRQLERGMNDLAGEIVKRSQAINPHQTGALENSTRVELKNGVAEKVAVGGVMAPSDEGFKMVSYARRRYYEGSRTGKDKWLTVAAGNVMRGDWEKHFRGRVL